MRFCACVLIFWCLVLLENKVEHDTKPLLFSVVFPSTLFFKLIMCSPAWVLSVLLLQFQFNAPTSKWTKKHSLVGHGIHLWSGICRKHQVVIVSPSSASEICPTESCCSTASVCLTHCTQDTFLLLFPKDICSSYTDERPYLNNKKFC